MSGFPLYAADWGFLFIVLRMSALCGSLSINTVVIVAKGNQSIRSFPPSIKFEFPFCRFPTLLCYGFSFPYRPPSRTFGLRTFPHVFRLPLIFLSLSPASCFRTPTHSLSSSPSWTVDISPHCWTSTHFPIVFPSWTVDFSPCFRTSIRFPYTPFPHHFLSQSPLPSYLTVGSLSNPSGRTGICICQVFLRTLESALPSHPSVGPGFARFGHICP